MTERVYKILRASEWAEAQKTGVFHGSADDRRDGFIHLSLASQVSGTLERHFSGDTGLMLLAFEAGSLGAALRMDLSRDGQLFPHLYAPLELSKAIGHHALELGGNGRHELPQGVV
ncbi:MAG: DUF952 domain-containing protein [Hyphomicrobiaceae bacterium]